MMIKEGAMQQLLADEQYLNKRISVWWDMQKCPVPEMCNPLAVLPNIRSTLRNMNYSGDIFIFCYVDMDRIPMTLMRVLSDSLQYVISDGPKDISDSMLTHMMRWALDNPPPANYLLISGDRDFSYALQQLRTRGNNILLAQPENDFAPLVADASSVWVWNTLSTGGPPLTTNESAKTMNKIMEHELSSDQFEKNCVDVLHAIFRYLRYIFDPNIRAFNPEKGKTSVVILVGLEGSGTTTTCTKYAYYHQKKGWKPALVCADAFSGAALDELKQNAIKAGIPFYESHTESDPVRIAVEGIERFKKENYDLIIVDLGVSEKPGETLSTELNRFSEATKPDVVIFVVDSKSALDAVEIIDDLKPDEDAIEFNPYVGVESVIVLKINGHEHDNGDVITALGRASWIKAAVIFIETGERVDEFEAFDLDRLVILILGACHWTVFTDKFMFRMLYAQYRKIDQILCPTHSREFQSELTILESMVNEEFDGRNPNRIMQLAYRVWSSTKICEECTTNAEKQH